MSDGIEGSEVGKVVLTKEKRGRWGRMVVRSSEICFSFAFHIKESVSSMV